MPTKYLHQHTNKYYSRILYKSGINNNNKEFNRNKDFFFKEILYSFVLTKIKKKVILKKVLLGKVITYY